MDFVPRYFSITGAMSSEPSALEMWLLLRYKNHLLRAALVKIVPPVFSFVMINHSLFDPMVLSCLIEP